MADKYFTGAGTNTNWNSSPVTNWANASYNGSNGNQTAPATGDRVFFDANSGTGAAVWNVSISLTGLDCTGSRNTVTHNSAVVFTISAAGNVILPTGVGASYTAAATSSSFTFTNTTGTVAFNTNGFTITGFTRSGIGGTTQLTGDCNCQFNTTTTGISLTGGTIDLNAHTLTCPIVSITGTNTRAITGTGSIVIANTLATANTPLSVTGSGFTPPASATLTFSGQFDGVHTVAFNALSWPATTFLGNGSYGGGIGKGQYSMTGANTFASLTLNGPINLILPASTQTITGAINTSGSYGNCVYIAAPGVTVGTLSIGSASTLDYCALRAITFSGAGAASGKNAIDLGCNTNVTLTPPGIGVGRSRLSLGH